MFKVIEGGLEERFFKELEWVNTGDFQRVNQDMPHFFYDYLMRLYGLEKLALKNIKSLSEGLRVKNEYPYCVLISKMLGFEGTVSKRASDAIVKARIVFNEGQAAWSARSREKGAKLREEQLQNVRTGGECNVFELLDTVLKMLDREMLELLVPRIRPGTYRKGGSKEERGRFFLDFSLMKICARLTK